MPSDEEIAKRAIDQQSRARDIPLMKIPGFMEWSEQKLAEGESPALIAHLDATAMWLLPEDVSAVSSADFNEMLDELKLELGEDGDGVE